jgi:alkane 1-monooxygenase
MSVRSTPWLMLIPLALPLLVVAGHAIGGVGEFLTPVVLFGLLPLLDRLLGDDASSPDAAEAEVLQARGGYTAALLVWVLLELALVAWALVQLRAPMTGLAFAGLLVSVGVITGGVGINVAHELGHRLEGTARGASSLLLLMVGYLHFQVEHNKGHHSWVGTEHDPASARRDESLWRFFPRTLGGSLASAWRFECEELLKAGRPIWHPTNRVLWSLAAWPLLAALGLAVAGVPGAVFAVGQALVAILLLEAVNYVEHYGLRRQRLADGRYERFSRQHAWDSPRRLSNIILFNLQRHSHHHQDVRRHYQGLAFDPEGPVLPSSYPVMIMLALVPPLFRAAVHPRLDRLGQDPHRMEATT